MLLNSSIHFSSVSIKKEGSIESQIFRLTNRITKLTYHFKTHNKDYSSQRGLWKILSRRKRLLTYLYNTNSSSYENLITELGIRRLKKD